MRRFTSFDGTGIAYHVWGEATELPDGPRRPDAARRADLPPVVLHHGFVVDAKINWALPGVVGALLSAGRTVFGIDARGHGASDKPAGPECYGEENMARDLSALFDEIGAERVHLVGYSMGAVVALLTAARDPRVDRLVVGGVGAGIVETGGVDTRAVPPQAIIAALTAEDDSAVPPAAREFRTLADGIGADRAALAAHARAIRPLDIPLGAITAPTLVIAGDADPLAARPEVLANAIPGARTTVLPGDHLATVGHPRFTSGIVGFLQD